MFTIDPESHIHPYQQLAEQLRERIADGRYRRKDGRTTSALPSLTELQVDTGLSLGTVQRAIRLLVDEGLVFTVRGRGVFVKRGDE